MTKRSAKSVPSILAVALAVIVAGPPLATMVDTATAADNCLTSPKGDAPGGRHWYYRIERGTGRHCWYIRDEKDADEKTAASAPVDLSPPKSVTPPRPAPAQKSVADARAELPMPQTRIEPDAGLAVTPRLPATPKSADFDRPAIAGNPDGQSSPLASRWPQPDGVNSAVDPVPAGSDRVAELQSNSGAAVPPPPTAAAAPVAVDASPQRPPASPWMLLIVVFGALSLAGIIGSAVLRFGGSRRSRRRPARGDRRAIWDSVDAGRPPHPVSEIPRRQSGFTNDTSRVDEASERIAQMLEQLRGRA